MATAKKIDLGMTNFDELFMTDAERKEVKLPRIYDIPIAEIDDFPNHPYEVRDDEDMQFLVENVKERGIITPATVRKKEDGRYEMISGHRRKRACELAGLETLRCDVVELDRDEAIILMVDSNLQRSNFLPMEKARAYQMKMEALKHQGKATSCPVGTKSEGRSDEQLAEMSNDSARQIQRYIRLNYLVPELQGYVNEGKIKMRPAVELSYLGEESQRDVVDRIDKLEVFPSHDQTIRMRKAFEEGALTFELVSEIMAEEKPNQKQTFKIPSDKVKEITRRDFTPKDFEDFWVKALAYYQKYLDRQKSREEAR